MTCSAFLRGFRATSYPGEVAVFAFEISPLIRGMPIMTEEVHSRVHVCMTFPAIAQLLSGQIQVMTNCAAILSDQ